MNTVYFARYIYLDNEQILHNGAITVNGNRIVDVGPRSTVKRTRDDRMVNLGDMLLLPGLINMHTHLEECASRGIEKLPEETFASYTNKRNSRIKQTPKESLPSMMRLCVREMIADGTTCIVDSSRTGLSKEVLKDESIRSWVIKELHEDCSIRSPNVLNSLTNDAGNSSLCTLGAGPHALYSLSEPAQKEIIDFTQKNNCLWATHLAESSEELQAFCEHAGDLYFHQTRKREWPFKKTKHGSVHYAINSKLIPHGGVCFHCNYINGEQLSYLSSEQVALVLCFRYNQMMGHKSFPLEVALNRGATICLGTEGVAAAGEMSLFDELYAIKTQHPHLDVKEMLRWVTVNPARALNMSDTLGSISPGKFADIVGVHFAVDTTETMLEELLIEEPEVRFVLVNGEEVIVT
ncbi:amidohydrolase family protein [Chitinispirillales bacterium ANBcel5]|uniref:amidohydrolase family protein n=1 Tax=Cellulosispirillum alkaliphilum TaxID=3039283 RepID=UPI002A4FC0F5|nr:amidohydrolase family protein [Chitinispirillales bacterium ANBcel5]